MILAILGAIVSSTTGLLCDWAIIHNYAWDPSTFAGAVYEVVIGCYTALSIISLVANTLSLAHISLFLSSPSYFHASFENGGAKHMEKMIETQNKIPRWKRVYNQIYLYVNTIAHDLLHGVRRRSSTAGHHLDGLSHRGRAPNQRACQSRLPNQGAPGSLHCHRKEEAIEPPDPGGLPPNGAGAMRGMYTFHRGGGVPRAWHFYRIIVETPFPSSVRPGGPTTCQAGS